MKKVRFDKLVSLSVEEKETETNVAINGAKFLYEDGKLVEKQTQLPARQANAITNKYQRNEKGNFSDEDVEAIQKERDEEVAKLPKEETILFVGEKNVIEDIKELINK